MDDLDIALMGGMPAWTGEMGDELSALTVKYIKIAQCEGCAITTTQAAMIMLFLRLAIHSTPARAERAAVDSLREGFDLYRPGWKRNP